MEFAFAVGVVVGVVVVILVDVAAAVDPYTQTKTRVEHWTQSNRWNILVSCGLKLD